jgi:hypothetical protein
VSAESRPAFYALAPGGWRDYVTLLDLARLGATLAAFVLAMGVGAHALDELRGRPLATEIPAQVLAALAALSIAAAVAIGIASCFWISAWLAPFIAFGGLVVVAYNLELLGGLLHNALWFALAWGAFPVLTGAFAQVETVRLDAVLAAAAAALLSHAQRRLSLPVRDLRRRVRAVSGSLERLDGTSEPVTGQLLVGAPEAGLQLLSAAIPLLAAALVVSRV